MNRFVFIILLMLSNICYGENVKIIPASDDAWTISEGKFDGHLTQIRYRPNMSKYLGHPKYPRRLTITWSYEVNPKYRGFPSSEELQEMQKFEIKTTDAFEENKDALLTFIFTTNGSREWHFYIQDVKTIGNILNSKLGANLPINIVVEDDPKWLEFSNVLSMTK